jgi:hypothetical protein
MQIDNLTNAGQEPVTGDVIRVTHINGSTEQYTYQAPVVIEQPPQTFLHITYPHEAAVGATITLDVSVKFADGSLVPMSADYYVPIIRDADGKQIAFKKVGFVDGAASVSFVANEAGKYIMLTDKIDPPPVSIIVDHPAIFVL